MHRSGEAATYAHPGTALPFIISELPGERAEALFIAMAALVPTAGDHVEKFNRIRASASAQTSHGEDHHETYHVYGDRLGVVRFGKCRVTRSHLCPDPTSTARGRHHEYRNSSRGPEKRLATCERSAASDGDHQWRVQCRCRCCNSGEDIRGGPLWHTARSPRSTISFQGTG